MDRVKENGMEAHMKPDELVEELTKWVEVKGRIRVTPTLYWAAIAQARPEWDLTHGGDSAFGCWIMVNGIMVTPDPGAVFPPSVSFADVEHGTTVILNETAARQA